MTQPTVTAIVVSYNTGPRLKDCLYALSADPEVSATVIVDNGNPAEMAAWIDQFVSEHAGMSLIRPEIGRAHV